MRIPRPVPEYRPAGSLHYQVAEALRFRTAAGKIGTGVARGGALFEAPRVRAASLLFPRSWTRRVAPGAGRP